MAKILITGINGFVGKHLVRELIGRGHSVVGTGLSDRPDESIAGLIDTYTACDLADRQQVAQLPLEGIQAVISLAGLAQVGASFDNPAKYTAVNVGVMANLCESLVRQKLNPRFIAVSTAYVYDPGQPLPITEQSRTIEKGSPYALSKLAMEKAGQQFRSQGQDIILVRPFNHIGPGQEQGFLVPDLFDKIRQSKGSIAVGDLTNRRDYTDVRDVVRAYGDLALAPKLGHSVYNIASGRSVTGQTILDLLLDEMGLAGKIKAVQDPKFLRPNDFKDLYSSHDRINKQTGWQPEIDLGQTIKDFVESQKSV